MRLFWLNLVQFFLLVANTRAFTQGNYLWTALTDIVLCFLGFTTIRQISLSKGWWDRVGYALGGVTGSLIAIYLTKIIYNN